jgi:uracil DNA glycosylase
VDEYKYLCITGFIQQAIEDQLSYEEATRKTLSTLNEKLANMVAIFMVAKGEKLIQHIPSFSKAVLASLPSPLAMGHCRQLWGVLCHSVFKQWTLGQ